MLQTLPKCSPMLTSLTLRYYPSVDMESTQSSPEKLSDLPKFHNQ